MPKLDAAELYTVLAYPLFAVGCFIFAGARVQRVVCRDGIFETMASLGPTHDAAVRLSVRTRLDRDDPTEGEMTCQ